MNFVNFRTSGKNNLIFLFNAILLVAIFLFAINSAQAAEYKLIPSSQNPLAKNSRQIDLVLNSQNERLNAFSGTVVLPRNITSDKKIKINNSIISYWIEEPQFIQDGANTKISFAGISLGGYSGNKGKLFSIIIQPRASGKLNFTLEDSRALLHDGKGTDAKVSIRPLFIAK